MTTTEENLLAALIEQLKKLNENIELYADVQLSHYIATGEIEMEDDKLDS